MLAIEQLESIGADASLITAKIKEQYKLTQGMSPTFFYRSKQWCIIIPDEDEYSGCSNSSSDHCQ